MKRRQKQKKPMDNTCNEIIDKEDTFTTSKVFCIKSKIGFAAIKPLYGYTKSTNTTVLFSTKMHNDILLESFRGLEPNWNGYGAVPIDGEVINNSILVLDQLIKQPENFPTGRNTVQFEYETDNGDYVELEVYNNRIHVYIEQGGNGSEMDYSFDQIQEINEAVNRIFGV